MGDLRRKVSFLALLGALLVTAVGCLPGGHGWSCDSDGECDKGLVCKQFNSVFGSKYCVSPGTTSIRSSSTYGWIKLVLFWAIGGIVGGTILLGGGVALVDAVKDRVRRK